MANKNATVERPKQDRRPDKPKSDKPKKKSIGRWFKETFSELKKVSWPPFSKVVKQTLVVLGVVLFFLVIFTAFDALLGWLHRLLVGGLGEPTPPPATEALSALSGMFNAMPFKPLF